MSRMISDVGPDIIPSIILDDIFKNGDNSPYLKIYSCEDCGIFDKKFVIHYSDQSWIGHRYCKTCFRERVEQFCKDYPNAQITIRIRKLLDKN